MTYLDKEEYEKLLNMSPIACIDSWVDFGDKNTVVVRRGVDPLYGHYAPPGGRIRKGESLDWARKRILKTEVGLDAPMDAELIGAYSIDHGFRHDIILAYYNEIEKQDVRLNSSQSLGYDIVDMDLLFSSPMVDDIHKKQLEDLYEVVFDGRR